jgi:hypothetical protein
MTFRTREVLMRSAYLAALAAVLTATSATAQNPDPDKAVAGGGAVVEGWMARPDRGSLENLNFRTMGSGYHVTTGPAVIVWSDANRASGTYAVVGSFTQTKAPAHPEAYGLMIGGQNLTADTQKYTYFLVRGDGSYLIKKRNGAETMAVTEGRGGWTMNEAVHKQDDSGKATNELTIRVGATDVAFLVNGTEVAKLPKSQVDTDGIAGMRVNHNLDVHIGTFRLERSQTE